MREAKTCPCLQTSTCLLSVTTSASAWIYPLTLIRDICIRESDRIPFQRLTRPLTCLSNPTTVLTPVLVPVSVTVIRVNQRQIRGTTRGAGLPLPLPPSVSAITDGDSQSQSLSQQGSGSGSDSTGSLGAGEGVKRTRRGQVQAQVHTREKEEMGASRDKGRAKNGTRSK